MDVRLLWSVSEPSKFPVAVTRLPGRQAAGNSSASMTKAASEQSVAVRFNQMDQRVCSRATTEEILPAIVTG
jgi:hypothetical protein